MKRSPLRSRPETTRAWLERSRKPIERRVRVKAVNPARKAKRRAEQFGDDGYADWLRDLGCLVCGRTEEVGCHHVRSRAAGGRPEDMIPLCRLCHTLVHCVGAESFPRLYGVDLREAADRLWLRWRAFAARPQWDNPSV